MRVSPSSRFAAPLFASTLLLMTGCANQNGTPTSMAQASIFPSPATVNFRDFYKSPVGPYGLEPTDKLLSLKGKRVRIQGYMVQEEEPEKGFFMISPVPVNIPEKEDGPSDDLPGSTVFVHMPREDNDKILAFRTGLWDLTGILDLGGKEEANGRVSYIRLLLDQPASQDPVKSESATGAKTASN